ncbi:flagellar motor switch protein FliM [Cupriavidus plantarum]|uniref:Flagellar motor switch protein FliM n=1 Tax=Cupriavidus plantarum TaxID=942865 RepID=A0A316EU15_9BURK|nr:flagellar motor switch protein FliM [Cupriavidus plantarum]NYI01221.1 flagellar motor switch protein FliM [Cupriavidus plantarum]PWK35611.1 flagellar motor switch protein FliM [Cupriavidus plantarum]REE94073.1 flagellar motor switch protein FliM [Cupriavidus plantarum]RLK39487.1 flagellar motor switch protein FliM [Cupriavidus plantarum]CAG2133481.1 Flagellar motor switch protein FliM [Cupriavidus plantarum]
MAYDKFLSQDEVDELLKGVSGETDSPEASSAPAADETGIRPYNLATQERIVRGRLHTLEIINERFARSLRSALFNFIRRGADISVGTVRIEKYGDFVRNLPVPTNLNLVHMKPLRGTALFVYDPNLVFLVVDNLFGGDGRFHTRVEGRDFTQTEQRIIRRMLDLTLNSYGQAWRTVHPIDLEFVRSEMHTKFANIAIPTEIVVTTAFHIELGAVGGQLHVCFPYSMIEPVRELLTNPLQDEVEVDKRWLGQLSDQLRAAEVELVAEFTHIESTVGDVLALRAGDVLPIELPEQLFGKVDGVPVMQCGFGTMNGQYALRVERMINYQDTDSNKETDHD